MELNDEQLINIVGGGSGNIPKGGITFSSYPAVQIGHYYSTGQNLNDVVYVFKIEYGQPNYTIETFTIDEEDNTWTSTSSARGHQFMEEFMYKYCFVLNIQP